MPYVNLTTTIAQPCTKSGDDFSTSSDVFQRHFVARANYIVAIPLNITTGIADTVVGLVARIGSLITGGAFAKINKIAQNHMKSLQELLSRPYYCLLRAINIHASFEIPPKCLGFAADLIKIFKDKAKSCRNTDDFITKHVVSRLNYMLFGIAALVTRAVDKFISEIAFILSLVTLGLLTKVNEVAYRSLMFPNLINDLTFSIVKVINPWASSK